MNILLICYNTPMEFLSGLNPAQKKAVLHKSGPLLIIAGAGAGKTKTLTHRILNLIVQGVEPTKILAITFTNKAAKEMKERVNHLIQTSKDLNLPINDTVSPFVSTFHALGVFLIRNEFETLGLKKHFSIYDRNDSKTSVKNIIKELGYDPKEYDPGLILNIISKSKSDLLTIDEFESSSVDNPSKELAVKVWRKYKIKLKEENALDFDDLLYVPTLILKDNKEVREKYQNFWEYIHIDEYQDTNEVQYQLVKMLTEKHQNICVVGDADQNIYSWRGATIKNILNFEEDYPNTTEIVLEENYRSTQNILGAANSVIQKNKKRKDKKLFTKNDEGEKLTVFNAHNEYNEGDFIVDRCRELLEKGVKEEEIAVLYRTNFQSRVLEEVFLRSKISYQLLGTRFFDRKEIKDTVSYLKFAMNTSDLTSLGRIINFPTRGIGKVSYLKICEGNVAGLTGKAKEGYESFRMFIARLQDKIKNAKPTEVMKFLVEESGVENQLQKDKESGEDRILNIKELISLASKYDEIENGMDQFLEDVSLLSDQDELNNNKNGVKLMTVHASKGLEFKHVFIVGLEQGLFPSDGFSEDKDEEEERRLFYVAVTRAEEKVFLVYASFRNIFGRQVVNTPSEFIEDIEDDYLEIFENEKTNYDRGDTGDLAKSIFIDF
jgi:DNA helicase-2/ATP-dependent DNA helicase PcrA